MKKIIKNRVFIFLATAILFAGIGVYAANTYQASEVIYNPSNGESTNVNEALNELYEKSSNKSVTFTYSGRGYMRTEQKAQSSSNIVNDNYNKITVIEGTTVKIKFNYTDGTSSSAVSVSKGNSLEVPDNVSSINCSSTSTKAAGDDGWGGQWLSATATITLE